VGDYSLLKELRTHAPGRVQSRLGGLLNFYRRAA
jgi:hypothetical protein